MLANRRQQALHHGNVEQIGMMRLPVRNACVETMQEIVGRVGKLTDGTVLGELLLVQPGERASVRLQIGDVPGSFELPCQIVEQHVGLGKLPAAEIERIGTWADACWHELEQVILALQRALGLGLAQADAQIEALGLIHRDQHVEVGLTLSKQRCLDLVNLFQTNAVAVTLDKSSNRFVRGNVHL